MEHLQLPPGSGCVRKNDLILRPTENGVHRNLFWSHSRNWDMFFVMPEIGSVRLKRCALAKILRLNCTKIDTSARYCKGGEQSHATRKGKAYQPLSPQGLPRVFLFLTVEVITRQRLPPFAHP